MAEVQLSEEAERDLATIFDYSVEHWGLEQAVAYLGQLDAHLARFADMPFTGTKRPDVGDDIRSLTCGSHVVYFTSDADQVRVARVLHGKMAPRHHL